MSPASRAVKIGYGLSNVLLLLALAFGAFLLASIVVGILRGGDSLLYGDTLTVPLQLSPEDVDPLPSGVRLDAWPMVNLEVEDPTTKQMLLRSVADLGPGALFIAGLWLVRAFLGSVLAGDPFGARNVQRLRAIGFLLVVGAPLVELLNYSLRLSLFNDLPPTPSVDLGVEGYTLPGGALLGGLGAFILAEVFAYGLQLREDVEATI